MERSKGMTVETHKETLGFQAEVKQLLDLMIHSLYGNKEIFLRELISNASDAADKLRFEALSSNALYGSDADLKIRVSFDKQARTLTVSDNGIGMSREEVVNNIGTIAKSGTREFFQSLTGDQAKDARLIGQFGVGFYSSFIVADRVTLLTRRAGLPSGEAVRWHCDMRDGGGEYTVEAAEKEGRGTDVVLHLRSSEDELLSDWKLKEIVRKYSDHIAIPIVMKKVRWDKEKSAEKITDEDETINQASALWARPKSEISEEQYQEFYKHVAHDPDAPLAYTHNRVEGRQEYVQLLYIPARAPFDLWDRHERRGLKLYVRRVFIMDDAEQLLPAYLRFVRGVIDSNDLPLNISREILQESRDIEAIRAGNTKRVLGLLEDLAELQSDDEKKEEAKQAGGHRALVAKLKDALGDRVKDVRVSSRLTASPSCLVADEHDMGGNLARILKAVGQKGPQPKPILEINPAHPMVQRLNAEKTRFADWGNLLFDQALLAEGGQLEDPAGFVRRMNELMLEMAGEGSRIIVPGR